MADLDAVPSRSSEEGGPQDAQERYLLARVDGARTVGELVRLSTLGPEQTLRVLENLAASGSIVVTSPRAVVAQVAAPAAARIETVLVADADRTQASLLRTMLRVSIGGSIVFHTASHADEVTQLSGQHRPDLLVVDYRLPGSGDGLALVRVLRAKSGAAPTPALIVAQRIEAEFIRARLLPLTGLVVRPIERAALVSAIPNAE